MLVNIKVKGSNVQNSGNIFKWKLNYALRDQVNEVDFISTLGFEGGQYLQNFHMTLYSLSIAS